MSGCTSQSVRALDLSNDRLENVPCYLSNDEPWQNFEKELSRHRLQVYDLKADTGHLVEDGKRF
ncbi:MAG TPA: hypothetical protein V6D14_01150 [Coleofasciculaceae cyanobacterium]